MFAFGNMIVQNSAGVMKVDGLDIDVLVEGVMVKRTAQREVSHIKAFMSDRVKRCHSIAPLVGAQDSSCKHKPVLQRRLSNEKFVDP